MNDFSEKPTSTPRDEPPNYKAIVRDLSASPVPVASAALWAGMLTAAHAVVWGGVVFYTLLFAVPRFKHVFEDFKMKLPWLTELVIDVSDVLTGQIFIPPLAFVFFTALDAVILFWLRRRRATAPLAWLWFVLFLVVPICISMLFWIAMLEPLLLLMESLSR